MSDWHMLEGTCSHCGRAIDWHCCGEWEGVWRTPQRFGNRCPSRPDTGPIDHEPIRNAGVLVARGPVDSGSVQPMGVADAG